MPKTKMVISFLLAPRRSSLARTNALQLRATEKDIWSGKALKNCGPESIRYCFLDRSAREVVGRSVVRPDRASGGPGTMVQRQPAAREVGRERPQILPRFRLENVNPHGLTLS